MVFLEMVKHEGHLKVKLLTKINMARIKKKLNMIKSFITQLLSLDVSKKDIFGSNLHSQL